MSKTKDKRGTVVATLGPVSGAATVTADPLQEYEDRSKVFDVRIDAIKVDGRNDRLVSDDEEFRQLAASISERGLLEPIVVGQVGDDPGYVLVAGHRRLAAVKSLRRDMIRAVVRQYSSDADMQLDRAIENLHRAQLNPIEEAYAISGMIETAMPRARQDLSEQALAGKALNPDDVEDVRYMAQVRDRAILLVARRLLRSPSWVRDRAYLAALSDGVKELVLDGRLPLTYAREIAKVGSHRRQDELGKHFSSDKHGRPGDFHLLRYEVSREIASLGDVPWRLDVAFAGAPACKNCPHNSANRPGLFEHNAPCSPSHSAFKEPAAGVCLSISCYREKAATANRQISAKARSIAKRVADLPAKQRPQITGAKVGEVGAELKVDVPKYLDQAELASRVKVEIARKPTAAGASDTKPQKSSTRDEAARKAQEALDDAIRERAGARMKAVEEAMKADPMRMLAILVLVNSTVWQAAGGWQEANRKKALASPGLGRLISMVKTPTIEAIKEQAKFLRAYDIWYDVPDDRQSNFLMDRVAEALGVELPPRPTLEQFLKPAEPAQVGKRTGSDKHAAKPRSTRGTPIVDDGEDDA